MAAHAEPRVLTACHHVLVPETLPEALQVLRKECSHLPQYTVVLGALLRAKDTFHEWRPLFGEGEGQQLLLGLLAFLIPEQAAAAAAAAAAVPAAVLSLPDADLAERVTRLEEEAQSAKRSRTNPSSLGLKAKAANDEQLKSKFLAEPSQEFEYHYEKVRSTIVPLLGRLQLTRNDPDSRHQYFMDLVDLVGLQEWNPFDIFYLNRSKDPLLVVPSKPDGILSSSASPRPTDIIIWKECKAAQASMNEAVGQVIRGFDVLEESQPSRRVFVGVAMAGLDVCIVVRQNQVDTKTQPCAIEPPTYPGLYLLMQVLWGNPKAAGFWAMSCPKHLCLQDQRPVLRLSTLQTNPLSRWAGDAPTAAVLTGQLEGHMVVLKGKPAAVLAVERRNLQSVSDVPGMAQVLGMAFSSHPADEPSSWLVTWPFCGTVAVASPAHAAFLIWQLLKVELALEAKSRMHCDISGGNVVVTADGLIFVIDGFTIQAIDTQADGLQSPDWATGTPRFMAMSLLQPDDQRKPHTPAADGESSLYLFCQWLIGAENLRWRRFSLKQLSMAHDAKYTAVSLHDRYLISRMPQGYEMLHPFMRSWCRLYCSDNKYRDDVQLEDIVQLMLNDADVMHAVTEQTVECLTELPSSAATDALLADIRDAGAAAQLRVAINRGIDYLYAQKLGEMPRAASETVQLAPAFDMDVDSPTDDIFDMQLQLVKHRLAELARWMPRSSRKTFSEEERRARMKAVAAYDADSQQVKQGVLKLYRQLFDDQIQFSSPF